VDVIGSREIGAGVEPADRNGKAATLTGGLAYDVSILLGVGRQLGSQPRAKVSMMIMRAPRWGAWARQHARGIRRNIRLLLRVGSRRSDIGCASLQPLLL
jgi:hypothetical protein